MANEIKPELTSETSIPQSFAKAMDKLFDGHPPATIHFNWKESDQVLENMATHVSETKKFAMSRPPSMTDRVTLERVARATTIFARKILTAFNEGKSENFPQEIQDLLRSNPSTSDVEAWLLKNSQPNLIERLTKIGKSPVAPSVTPAVLQPK